MSGAVALNDRVAKCGGCGAELVFAIGSSRLKVCEYCRYVSARTPQGVEGLGTVAEVVPTGARLTQGLLGTFEGVGFRLAGRLQLQWAQGVWDEWYAAFDDGRWGWIAEAQGRYYVSFRVSARQVPPLAAMRPGRAVSLHGLGRFVVTDHRVATYVSATGELPESFPLDGTQVHLVDLSGKDGAFATFDFGDGSSGEPTIFNGREVRLEALRLQSDAFPTARPAAKSRELTCSRCNAPLELFNPEEAKRVTCTHCGSLLDASEEPLRFLEKLKPPQLQWPLGSEAKFDGVAYRVAGWMERECNVYGETYTWQEYLLYDPKDASYRYLLMSDHHWSFVTPLAAGDVEGGPGGATYQGRSYRKFSRVLARVRQVWGEFPWAVAKGETAYAIDYIAPPEGLSEERSESEINWSHARYLTPREVWAAFGRKTTPKEPAGVAPLQPNPWAKASKSMMRTALAACALAVLMFTVFIARSESRVVLDQQVTYAAGQMLGGEELVAMPSGVPDPTQSVSVAFSQPFTIEQDRRNLRVDIDSNVQNGWVWVSGALVEETTGEVRPFGLESSYYSGRDYDGEWRENNRRAKTYLSSIGAGTWVLRTEAVWPRGQAAPRVDVKLTSGVVRVTHFFLVILLLLTGPAFFLIRSGMFEQARWEQSSESES